MEKFGRTLLMAVFLFLLFAGIKMAIRVGDPYVRRVSPSFANVLLMA